MVMKEIQLRPLQRQLYASSRTTPPLLLSTNFFLQGAKLYVPTIDCELFDTDGKTVAKSIDDMFETQFNRLLDLTHAMRSQARVKTVPNLPGKTIESINEFKGWSLGAGFSYLLNAESTATSIKRKPGRPSKALYSDPTWPPAPATPSKWTETGWRVLNWHMANIEGPCAADVNLLDLKDWDQDDPYEFTGDHCLIISGYSRTMNQLLWWMVY